MQPVDKTVGPLASSQIDLNEGRGGDIVGDQLLDLGRRRGRPDHLRPNGPKKQLQQLLRRDTGTVVVAVELDVAPMLAMVARRDRPRSPQTALPLASQGHWSRRTHRRAMRRAPARPGGQGSAPRAARLTRFQIRGPVHRFARRRARVELVRHQISLD
jgi:hypothetical protein